MNEKTDKKLETVLLPESEPKMIPVLKIEYWDNTKYIIRTDKPAKDVQELIKIMSRKKGNKFLQLSVPKQLRIKKECMEKMGGLVLITTNLKMSEAEFLKTKADQDFVKENSNGKTKKEKTSTVGSGGESEAS